MQLWVIRTERIIIDRMIGMMKLSVIQTFDRNTMCLLQVHRIS